jgi:uncharacterized protein (TIGR03067 family)
MRRTLVLLPLALLLAAAYPDLDPEPPAPDADAKNLLGTWKAVKFESNGKPLEVNGPGQPILDWSMEVGKEKVTVSAGGVDRPGTWTIDPKKKPKQITFTYITKVRLEGIYEIKGDEMKMTFKRGAELPQDFASAKGVVMTLKREAKK